MKMTLGWIVLLLLLLCLSLYIAAAGNVLSDTTHSLRRFHRSLQESSTTCAFDDGQVFEAGQALPASAFTNRCGSADEWPCYCSPNRDPPVECPYCGLADLNASNGLTCAKNGEAVTVAANDGTTQRCECNVEITSGTPVETCVEEEPGDGGEDDNVGNDDVCTVELFDGTTITFQNGESYGEFFPTGCRNESGNALGGGDDNALQFQCNCNTALPGQVDCPFCTFVDIGGDLYCANRLDTTVLQDPDLGPVECACFDDLTSACRPVSPTEPPVPNPSLGPPPLPPSPPTTTPSSTSNNDADTDAPTRSPLDSDSETLAPFLGPTLGTPSPSSPMAPSVPPPAMPSDSAFDTLAPSIPPTNEDVDDDEGDIEGDIFDKTSGRPALAQDPSLGGCLFHNRIDNTIDFIEEGATFDIEMVNGPCSPSAEWPVYCNPAVPGGGMEYPYCVFETRILDDNDGSSAVARNNADRGAGVVCGRSEERVLVTSPDGTTQECSCLYFNPELGPVSSCDMVILDLIVTLVPTSAPTILDSDSDDDDLSADPANNGDEQGGDNDESSAATPPRIRLDTSSFCILLLLAFWQQI